MEGCGQVQGRDGYPVIYSGSRDCVKRMYQAEGIRAFWRGSITSFLKASTLIMTSSLKIYKCMHSYPRSLYLTMPYSSFSPDHTTPYRSYAWTSRSSDSLLIGFTAQFARAYGTWNGTARTRTDHDMGNLQVAPSLAAVRFAYEFAMRSRLAGGIHQYRDEKAPGQPPMPRFMTG